MNSQTNTAAPAPTTLGVLLAAGAGSRFIGPTHKLLTDLFEEPLIIHAFRSMMNAQFPAVLIVTGPDEVHNFISGTQLDGVFIKQNPDWRTGQRSSVQCAINFAREHHFSQVVIGLADQPFVTVASWVSVSLADSAIAVATYAGVRGNPVKLENSVWKMFELESVEPDSGARDLMHLHPELVIEVACDGSNNDIDTVEDLQKWT